VSEKGLDMDARWVPEEVVPCPTILIRSCKIQRLQLRSSKIMVEFLFGVEFLGS